MNPDECDACHGTGECLDVVTGVHYLCNYCYVPPYDDEGQPDELQENQDFAHDDDHWHDESDFEQD